VFNRRKIEPELGERLRATLLSFQTNLSFATLDTDFDHRNHHSTRQTTHPLQSYYLSYLSHKVDDDEVKDDVGEDEIGEGALWSDRFEIFGVLRVHLQS